MREFVKDVGTVSGTGISSEGVCVLDNVDKNPLHGGLNGGFCMQSELTEAAAQKRSYVEQEVAWN